MKKAKRMLFTEREEKALYESLQLSWAMYKTLGKDLPIKFLKLIERFEKEHEEWFDIEE